MARCIRDTKKRDWYGLPRRHAPRSDETAAWTATAYGLAVTTLSVIANAARRSMPDAKRAVSVENNLGHPLVSLGAPACECRIAGEKFEAFAQLQFGARLTLLVLT